MFCFLRYLRLLAIDTMYPFLWIQKQERTSKLLRRYRACGCICYVGAFATPSRCDPSAISTSTRGAPPAVVRSGSVRMVYEGLDCSDIPDISIFLLSGTCEFSRSMIGGGVFVFKVTIGGWRESSFVDGLEDEPCGAGLEDFREWITLGFMDASWFTSLSLSKSLLMYVPLRR
jgi:hypothetical protein